MLITRRAHRWFNPRPVPIPTNIPSLSQILREGDLIAMTPRTDGTVDVRVIDARSRTPAHGAAT